MLVFTATQLVEERVRLQTILKCEHRDTLLANVEGASSAHNRASAMVRLNEAESLLKESMTELARKGYHSVDITAPKLQLSLADSKLLVGQWMREVLPHNVDFELRSMSGSGVLWSVCLCMS